ncbi:antitoxin VbhA family protein [Janthinobacterium sp. 17J80-10]|uniref:antitoxin VbhA family protein n=1 Tax=Janthinobacterium sp. 17J80-10 TaxID=2497863 RepID=UPI001005764D|nr:antitoxin VbhA family protein [Janthinobacterium sp. 17J80-10]QAU35145.1 hypothetical protein EKL02_13695 [Janthinobacterium sp. 17J80-10]
MSKSFFSKLGEDKLVELAKAAADEAIKEAHAAGLPVTGTVNGVISRVYPDGRVQPLTEFKERQKSVEQTLASWALEGFVPDAEYRALLDRYIDGSMTIEQISAATDVKLRLRARE